MRRTTLGVIGGTVLAMACATASAAPAPITATVPAGHRLVALSRTGAVTASTGSGRNVVLTPPAARVTLHLIGPTGRYAGPVRVGRVGRRALLGVRAGARLGVIRRVHGGFVAMVPRRFTDASRTALADAYLVPRGARSLGLVASTARGVRGTGTDQDLDGVPGAFDIDDDGDRILDNLEAGTTAGIAQVGPAPGVPGVPAGPAGPSSATPRVFSNLKLAIDGSLNANAGATRERIDAALSGNSTLAIAVPGGEEVELDCGTLSYCTTGGTGKVLGGAAFPDSVDADGDGFGTLTRAASGDFQLQPGATSGAIGSGDTFIWRVTNGGITTTTPGVLNYQFVTTPAIAAYRVGAGPETTITYPVPPNGVGTRNNPITVPGTGDVSVTLTVWRPQRAAIAAAGETGDWVDIGGLRYSADMPNGPELPGSPGGQGPGMCSATHMSTTDAALTAAGDGMLDGSADATPDPSHTLTFTVDVTGCLAARTITWSPGATLKVDVQARTTDGDNAAQAVWLRRAS